MRRLLRLVPALVALGLLAFPATASAVHNRDLHSSNTLKLFESPNTIQQTNSDIAYWGNLAYVGNYGGVRIFDISNPAAPQLLSDFRCFGPQNDPAVWGNLLFLAIDRTLTGPNCGATATAAHDDPNGWEGVRIIDVSDPRNPTQVGAVYQDCGAHTITLWPQSPDRILLYVSSYPLNPGPTCGPVRGPQAGRHPHHGVIQVIEVPVNNPSAAREIAEPPINYPGDPDNAFNPAEHNLPLLTLRACHDIGVFVRLRLAAAACAEQAQLWRIGADGIPDTANPIWVQDEVTDTDGPGGGDVQVDFWHSATFSWDGKVVNFIDESFGDGCPTVTPVGLTAPRTPSDSGWMFFYDTQTGAKRSQMKMERPDTHPSAYCSAHLGNVVPALGNYFLVNAWYTGGMNVVDFTNPSRPREVAYYDTSPNNPAIPAPGGSAGSFTWSAYWYENRPGDNSGFWLWGNDINRGFQVFRTTMQSTDVALTRLNPQTQEDTIRCRVTVAAPRLRARTPATVRATVRIAPGVAIVPGQAAAGVPVRLRGPGVNVNTTANGNGVARVSGVAATRAGTLRVSVPTIPNMAGCRASARIAAAPRVRAGGRGAGGPALTGRPR